MLSFGENKIWLFTLIYFINQSNKYNKLKNIINEYFIYEIKIPNLDLKPPLFSCLELSLYGD